MSGYRIADGARAAASLLLLRDGADGLEVLMLRRAERHGDQRSGAAVFPGGVLDARDRLAHGCCGAAADAAASAELGVADGGLDYRVAAVRETFEEVGILLVHEPFDAAALHPWRDRLQNGEAGIAELCSAENLTLDVSGMAYFSHWLTPPGAPKRFDTRFFAALAPPGQVAQADMGEAVELMWLTPAAALAAARGLKLLPVTRRTLEELSRHADAAAAMAAVRVRTHVPLIMPRRCVTASGPGVVLPGDWPYAEVAKLDPEGGGDAASQLLPGRAVRLSPRIVRVTAPNPGPMTGPGTNSYIVGGHTVIDPGPAEPRHVQALLDAVAADGGRIERIVVTHTHRDHSPGTAALAAVTGAAVFGRMPAHAAGQDETFAPQRQLQHGERLPLPDGSTLRVLHTPGHASNHLCFLLEEERLLFTGDHVMQGSTVVINPPDGDMAAYLASLGALLDEPLDWLAPGHGFLVAEPRRVIAALVEHRLKREAKVLAAVRASGSTDVQTLLPQVYDDVPPALHPVAFRSLLAHLLKLQQDGVLGPPGVDPGAQPAPNPRASSDAAAGR